MKIARVLLVVSVLSVPWLVNFQTSGGSGTAAVAFAAPPDGAPAVVPEVDVNINGGGTTEKHIISFQNPVVVIAAIVGVVLIVALIAMASRGGGTTIIKE